MLQHPLPENCSNDRKCVGTVLTQEDLVTTVYVRDGEIFAKNAHQMMTYMYMLKRSSDDDIYAKTLMR